MTDRFSINDLRGSQDPDDLTVVIEAAKRAVDSLLSVHAATGIDLTQWEELLPLVTLVYPYIVLEGTGPTDENTSHAATETGRLWFRGA